MISMMCGRTALIKPDAKKLKERFDLYHVPESMKPRYNIAPSQDLPVILNETPKDLQMVKWGLLPSWAKEENTKYSMINARAETITEKPAYRGPIKRKRCLIIADTFYEWQKLDGGKQPYRIFMKGEEPFAMAGVWDRWEKNDKIITTCAIITTSPNKLMTSIHDRMPVILPKEKEEEYLTSTDMKSVLDLLTPYKKGKMEAYKIDKTVNSPNNDYSEVIQPL